MNKYFKLKATVSGVTCDGENFVEEILFEMLPPKNSNCYGTGYYMSVKMKGQSLYIDVRYEKTTDVEILADRWIKSYFGNNAKEVTKEFVID